MFHKFCWVFMILIGAMGYLQLQRMTHEDRLLGIWETDVAKTIEFNGILQLNGATPTPEMIALIEKSGYLLRMEIRGNGTIFLSDHAGNTKIAGKWSENEKYRETNSRILDIKSEQGKALYGFQ